MTGDVTTDRPAYWPAEFRLCTTTWPSRDPSRTRTAIITDLAGWTLPTDTPGWWMEADSDAFCAAMVAADGSEDCESLGGSLSFEDGDGHEYGTAFFHDGRPVAALVTVFVDGHVTLRRAVFFPAPAHIDLTQADVDLP